MRLLGNDEISSACYPAYSFCKPHKGDYVESLLEVLSQILPTVVKKSWKCFEGQQTRNECRALWRHKVSSLACPLPMRSVNKWANIPVTVAKLQLSLLTYIPPCSKIKRSVLKEAVLRILKSLCEYGWSCAWECSLMAEYMGLLSG